MSEFSWVGLINKLLNVAVLGIACIYLVKKYAYTYIKKSLEERATRVLELKKEAFDLQEKSTLIAHQTAESQLRAKHLLTKIELWKEALKAQEKENNLERQRIEQASLVYLKMRADGLCHEYVKRTISMEIFARTEKELRDFFLDKNHQKQYLESLIRIVEKRGERG